MDVRTADPDDSPRVREIARDSFTASYSLSPQQIETIVEEEFSDEALSDRIEDPDVVVLVAEHDVKDVDGVVGFADVDVGADGAVQWLHVDPQARSHGVGTALVERARDELEDAGGVLAGRILEESTEGGEFLERFDLGQSGTDRRELGEEEFQEQVYTEGTREKEANEPAVEVPETVGDEGERFVDRDDQIPGSEAPFFIIYTDEGHEEQYGYFCSNCGSTDVVADGLDRLECDNCGNTHRAEEWDGGYL